MPSTSEESDALRRLFEYASRYSDSISANSDFIEQISNTRHLVAHGLDRESMQAKISPKLTSTIRLVFLLHISNLAGFTETNKKEWHRTMREKRWHMVVYEPLCSHLSSTYIIVLADTNIYYKRLARYFCFYLHQECHAWEFKYSDVIIAECLDVIADRRSPFEARVIAAEIQSQIIGGHVEYEPTLFIDDSTEDGKIITTAINANADIIVTDNTKDFIGFTEEHGMYLYDFDQFLAVAYSETQLCAIQALVRAVRQTHPEGTSIKTFKKIMKAIKSSMQFIEIRDEITELYASQQHKELISHSWQKHADNFKG